MSALAPGLVVAAPNSGSGKTLVTMGIVAALRAGSVTVAVAKAGPDYIDTGFLAAAAGRDCINLDPWAMRQSTLSGLVSGAATGADILIIEGVMGLFDGGTNGVGSTADLAMALGLPVVLVVNTSHHAQSVGALVRGFHTHRANLGLAGVILNQVAGSAHEKLIREGFAGLDVPILGTVGRRPGLALASRHLGLVQAVERAGLDTTIDQAAELIGAGVDLAQLRALARPPRVAEPGAAMAPPGQRIAVGFDRAFGFAYHHLAQGWRDQGAQVLFFSPLADEAPDASADVVFLPGGYPELHAGTLAANNTFLEGLRAAKARGCLVHGECGGYMVLGDRLVDGDGNTHAMAGLLRLETSFATPRLTLGYRVAQILEPWGFCPGAARLRGHEFHYAQVLREVGEPLFECRSANGDLMGNAGLRQDNVSGSFFHLIDVEK
ncbi:MAG: cobyrinate a,c-diamide synthase [Alphaproteobacteria bacterium]